MNDDFEANFQIVECRECGAPFNLGAQPYYGGLCPECNENEDEE